MTVQKVRTEGAQQCMRSYDSGNQTSGSFAKAEINNLQRRRPFFNLSFAKHNQKHDMSMRCHVFGERHDLALCPADPQ
jgi:hypothetical protein